MSTESERTPAERHVQTVMLVERVAVLLLLALLLYGVAEVLRPFALAIAFGGFIAIGTWPARDALVNRGVRPAFAAGLLLLVLILLVAVPATLIVPDMGDEIVHAVARAPVAGGALARATRLGDRAAAGGPARRRPVDPGGGHARQPDRCGEAL